MRKIFILLATLVFLTGCDDGDMTVKDFDFINNSDLALATCTGNDNDTYKLYYKKSGTEVLVLNIASSALLNIASDTPLVVTVGGTSGNTLTYRNYDGTVEASTICTGGGLPPASPNVIEEWTGDGTLEILTVEVRNTDDNVLTGYTHDITIRDVSLTKNNSDEEIRMQDSYFGPVTSQLGFTFDFEGTDEIPILVQDCSETKIFKVNTKQALQLNFPAGTFVNNTTLIEKNLETEDDYEVLFRVFSSSIANSNTPFNYICQDDPQSPTQLQRWAATEGTLRIITTVDATVPGQYNHEIRFYDLVFSKVGSSTEKFVPETTDTDGSGNDYFLFGVYSTN